MSGCVLSSSYFTLQLFHGHFLFLLKKKFLPKGGTVTYKKRNPKDRIIIVPDSLDELLQKKKKKMGCVKRRWTEKDEYVMHKKLSWLLKRAWEKCVCSNRDHHWLSEIDWQENKWKFFFYSCLSSSLTLSHPFFFLSFALFRYVCYQRCKENALVYLV